MHRVGRLNVKLERLRSKNRIFFSETKTTPKVNENVSVQIAAPTPSVKEETAAVKPVESVKVNDFLYSRPLIKKEKYISFDDIPGPISLRLISKFWEVFPAIGNEMMLSAVKYIFSGGKFFGGLLSWGGNASFFRKFFRVYGPVVRLHGAFGSDVVLLSRPEHASAIFQNEGPYPVRSCMESMEKYRSDYKKYRQPGPVSMYGPNWENLRKSIEIPLHNVMHDKLNVIDDISNEFVERILTVRNKQEEVPNNFRSEIMKWSLECLGFLTLNKKLGFLDLDGLSPNSEQGKILECLDSATQALSKCEYGFQFWRFFHTPAFKSLCKNCDVIEGVLAKNVEETIKSLKERKDVPVEGTSSFLEYLVLKEAIYEEDIITVLLDIFLIGANATTHTVAFLFYHLAKNPRCQMKLHDETKYLTKTATKEEILNLSYMQACIKEVLRLNPPIPILTRILNKDVVVHQYPIPKGTYVLFANHLNGTNEEYFEDATKFKPERWLSNELGGFGNDYQTFAYMPFGYGAKACFAKQIVNMQIATLMVKVCNHFKIEYNYGEIGSSNEMLATPNKPLRFRFIDRI